MAKKSEMGTIYPGRIRSLLRNEDTTKTQISMYVSENSSSKEGDVIIDEYNYEWIVKRSADGKLYKEKQSKLAAARTPWWCPKCEKIMTKRLDTKMYQDHGMCFDCVIERDTQMQIDGTFKEYETNFILSRAEGFLTDSKKEIESYLKNVPNALEIVNEDGSFEKWEGNVGQIKEFFKKELVFIEGELEKIKKYRTGELGEFS